MTLKIGDHEIHYGNHGANNFQTSRGAKAFIGLNGDDRFTLRENNLVFANGRLWDKPHVASGGNGSDYYDISFNSSAIIIDDNRNGNKSETGKLVWGAASWNTYAYTVDNRHIALVDKSGHTSAIIIDGLNGRGRIEELKIDNSWVDVSSNSVKELLSSYNYSFHELINLGVIYPPAMGLDDAHAVRMKIQEFYDSPAEERIVNNYARNLLSALTLRGSRQFQFNSFEA